MLNMANDASTTGESEKRRELVDEVKDLTAKNAEMLQKFREFS